MKQSTDRALTLELRHTGERLTLRRIKTDKGIEELHLSGSLPAHGQGPPLHVHFEQDEHGEVIWGTLSASADGKKFLVAAGGSARFARGSAHRWWNDGEQELVLRGVATPAVDLDRYLQAMFEVLNAGPPNHPPIFYMAHVLYRHRKTQLALVVPRVLQRVLFPIVVLLGTVLGKYRGTAWPGCPSRCLGAPLASRDDALV
jgi:mannose-6-phosphate isomerase-like protein (cupin superfamily)